MADRGSYPSGARLGQLFHVSFSFSFTIFLWNFSILRFDRLLNQYFRYFYCFCVSEININNQSSYFFSFNCNDNGVRILLDQFWRAMEFMLRVWPFEMLFIPWFIEYLVLDRSVKNLYGWHGINTCKLRYYCLSLGWLDLEINDGFSGLMIAFQLGCNLAEPSWVLLGLSSAWLSLWKAGAVDSNMGWEITVESHNLYINQLPYIQSSVVCASFKS